MGLNVKSVLEFLYKNQFYQSFFVLEQESQMKYQKQSSDLEFIYDLISKGDFAQVLFIISPLKSQDPGLYFEIYSKVLTQDLLEKIDKCYTNLEEISENLKEIAEIDGKEHAEKIYKAVVEKNISNFENWSVWKGRVACWEKISEVFSNVFKEIKEIHAESAEESPNSLEKNSQKSEKSAESEEEIEESHIPDEYHDDDEDSVLYDSTVS